MARKFLRKTVLFSKVIAEDSVHLSVTEIENAAVLEVLQTPGAKFGTWNFLETLLTESGSPSGDNFTFNEPFGHAKEVKTSLSNLFGRFVARAYLKKEHGMSVISHVNLGEIKLNCKKYFVERKRNRKGDLPDWVASEGKNSPTCSC